MQSKSEVEAGGTAHSVGDGGGGVLHLEPDPAGAEGPR